MRIGFKFAFTDFTLFFYGKLINILTFGSAASAVLFSTGITLNKQQVAIIIFTVGMLITFVAALMASADHIFRNPLTKPFIKNKVLSNKSRLQFFTFQLAHIVNDAAVQLINILETHMF